MFSAAIKTKTATSGYQISRSLRFNSADSANLTKTLTTPTNNKIFTFSGWIKCGSINTDQGLFCAPITGTTQDQFRLETAGTMAVYWSSGGGGTLITTQVFRDPSAWYHFVLAVDTTQATASNRAKIYVNGVQVTAFSTASYPSQNYAQQFNSALAHDIGGPSYNGANYFSGYMTEINFIDGSQLTPSSFGETNAQTGVWQPKAYSGSYGTNGFYLNFSDNSNTTAATLGKDYSGNGNNWTPNNFSVTAGAGNDSLVDSPTSYGTDTGVGGTVRGNYATFNPLDVSGTGTILDGNLQLNGSSGAWYQSRCGFGLTSGKWYWEVYIVATNEAINGICIGIANSSVQTAGYNTANQWSYNNNNGGRKGLNTVSTAYGTAFITADTVGVAFDADAGSITFYVNNSSQGVAASSGLPNPAFPTVSAYGTDKVAINFGQRPFAYTAPSGYKALCTQNLPTPTIGATTATQASQFFAPALYTGNGATQTVTVGFQPDLVWCKSRSNAYWNTLVDSVRGRAYISSSNVTNAETGPEPSDKELTAFTSSGFSLGPDYNLSINSSGATFVSWNWKANGSGSTNTAGSITSTVSANTTSGFSVVTWTSTGSAATIGHGLGVAPSMIITKTRNVTDDWYTYFVTLGNAQLIKLNSTAAAGATTAWNSTSPTSTVFSTSAGFASNGTTQVAYCFAEVAGYSKFGSYTGNGSTDGPFCFTGMRPAYVMIKQTSAAAPWIVFDAARNTANAEDNILYPNTSGAEDKGVGTSPLGVDFLSNGFKIRNADAWLNGTSSTYIYMAFASVPLKFSLAR